MPCAAASARQRSAGVLARACSSPDLSSAPTWSDTHSSTKASARSLIFRLPVFASVSQRKVATTGYEHPCRIPQSTMSNSDAAVHPSPRLRGGGTIRDSRSERRMVGGASSLRARAPPPTPPPPPRPPPPPPPLLP